MRRGSVNLFLGSFLLAASCGKPAAPHVKNVDAGSPDNDGGDVTDDAGDWPDAGDIDGGNPATATVTFTKPGAQATSPVTFAVAVTGAIVEVQYVADGKTVIGHSTDAVSGFAMTVTFSQFGQRTITAIGLNDAGTELARADLVVTILEPPSLALLTPAATATNPVTLTAKAHGAIVKVTYIADGKWTLGSSSDASHNFAVTYSFSQLGARKLTAIGTDAQNLELARDERTVQVAAAAVAGKLGAWLWLISDTGLTHGELADKLVKLGVGRIYVKTAEGSHNCDWFPDACGHAITDAYHQRGLEVWGWSFSTLSNPSIQADALTQAATDGYDGYVLDIESNYDGQQQALRDLLSAFSDARTSAISKGLIANGWPIYSTSWGNPLDHNMHVEIMDQYVDAHMPQTYLEVWDITRSDSSGNPLSFGNNYMPYARKNVQRTYCEYRGAGAKKPIHQVVSDEYGKIYSSEIDEFITAGGPETSLWRIPGGGVSATRWNDWSKVNWVPTTYDADPTCP